MRVVARDLVDLGVRSGPDLRVVGAQHALRHRPVRTLPARSAVRLRRRSGRQLDEGRSPPGGAPVVSRATPRPTLAVWKFASCDGCQLTLLDCEDELLAVAERVDIAHFLEASRATVAGPYDLSLVEGSVTTAADVERITEIRRRIPAAGHDRRLRHRRWHPGVAQLGRRRGVPRHRLRIAELHLDAGHVDPDLGPRAGRLRAARLPDRQGTAPRRHQRLPRRASARTCPATACASSASCAGTCA